MNATLKGSLEERESASKHPQLSVIVPVYNEEENFPLISAELLPVLTQSGYSYEIIFVDDGSSDHSYDAMLKFKENNPETKIIRFRKNKGKSEALSAGFESAQGDMVATIDADLQEPPKEILNLIKKLENGYGLVSGWRHKRRDPLGKKIGSKLFNITVQWLTRINLHDINCGLKIYKREVVRNVRLYGELHRVIPLLVSRNGFAVGEMKVEHQPRRHGAAKFNGFSRGYNGLFDTLSVLFLTRYENRPLHFFGMVGLIVFCFGLGVVLLLSLYYILGFGYTGGHLPLFLLGVLSMILGFQSFSLGLIGEMLVRKNPGSSPGKDRIDTQ